MRITALAGMIMAFALCLAFLYGGVSETIPIKQLIMMGLMLATTIICLSNIEK